MKKHLPLFLLFYFILSNNALFAQRIAAGGRHSLAICADSTVQAWGYNGYGQLGNGNIIEEHSGTKVIGLSEIIQVAGGLFHSLFVKSDGTVWACGRNTLGPLGDGTTIDKWTPVQISGLSDIIQVAGGGEHSLFLKNDGTVWACGNNSSGQLGDGTNVHKSIPVQISTLADIIQVVAGAEFSLFLKIDGTVWACGHNGFGQFGNGTNTSKNIPVQVTGLSDIAQISAGEWHSLFVKNDETVYSSGRNQYGQLGDGTIIDNNTASPISTLSGITQADAGGIHSVFLEDNGSVWSCGLNSGGNNDGQLGDGTAIDKHTPVQVIAVWGNDPIVHVEATREHSLFLHADGTLWAAGRNNYGQLGYGIFTTANSSIPVLSSTVCNILPTNLTAIPLQERDITIFPNPTSSYFNLTFPGNEFQVRIFTVLGQKVYSTIASQNVVINLGELGKGLYMVQLVNGDKYYYRQVVKK